MDWLKKIWELVQSRKFYGAIVGVLAAWQIYEAAPKTPETTAALIVAVVTAIAVWINAQGRVDAAKMKPLSNPDTR
jgi:hypothetical protein